MSRRMTTRLLRAIALLSVAAAGCRRTVTDEASARGKDNEELHRALCLGDTVEVQRLLAAEASIRGKHHHGNRALHLAALCGRCLKIQPLIEQGADVAAGEVSGQTGGVNDDRL